MLDRLPLELVGEVLRITAEECLPMDRQTICNIALSSSLGYGSAIPVLYSGIVINRKNEDYVARVFDEDSVLTSGPLHIAPSQRLCPLIRRIYLEMSRNRLHVNIRHLINLQAIFSLTLGDKNLPPSMYPNIAPTLKQCYILSVEHPDQLPTSVTHVSYYIRASANFFAAFQDYAERTIAETITHVSLELNEAIQAGCETSLLSLLRALLTRNSSAPVTLRLYDNAISEPSETFVLKAIARLEPERLRRRVQLWRDHRPITMPVDDINTSKADCIVGRTPWAESESLSQTELDAAEKETLDPVDEEEHRASRD